MSQPIVYNNTFTDNSLARRYTGYPLNSTLVSSYTPDTIRSIITHAASGQPYSKIFLFFFWNKNSILLFKQLPFGFELVVLVYK